MMDGVERIVDKSGSHVVVTHMTTCRTMDDMITIRETHTEHTIMKM